MENIRRRFLEARFVLCCSYTHRDITVMALSLLEEIQLKKKEKRTKRTVPRLETHHQQQENPQPPNPNPESSKRATAA
jgi:hypothetical protein